MSQILKHINANMLLLALSKMQTHCFAVFITMTTKSTTALIVYLEENYLVIDTGEW